MTSAEPFQLSGRVDIGAALKQAADEATFASRAGSAKSGSARQVGAATESAGSAIATLGLVSQMSARTASPRGYASLPRAL